MNHKGFFGISIKQNSKKLDSKRDDEYVKNKLFANSNLRNI